MKFKALVLTLFFAAGVVASVAIAKGPPEGKGKNKQPSTASTGTSTGTTTDKHAEKKMWICHKAGPNGKFVKIRINKKAWPAHQAHGDHELAASSGSTTTGTTTGATTGKAKKKGKNKAPAGSCSAGGGGGTTSTATTATTS